MSHDDEARAKRVRDDIAALALRFSMEEKLAEVFEAERGDPSKLIALLRDKDRELSMAERSYLANLLEGRPNGRPADEETKLHTCGVVRRYLLMGGGLNAAQFAAAKELEVSERTVERHLRWLRENNEHMYQWLLSAGDKNS